MSIYLLKMMACSAAFYALYALLFRKEKMFVFGRFYLLGTLVLSFFIPLITITVAAPETTTVTRDVFLLDNEPEIFDVPPPVSDNSYLIFYLIAGMAILISCILLIRFIRNLHRIYMIQKQSEQMLVHNIRMVLIRNKIPPYSFMNSIYVNESEFRNGDIEAEVLEHEFTHIRQKHSLDILFVEVLQIFTWFNPVLYLYKRSIRINHELLADAEVVKKSLDISRYQKILLQKAALLSDMRLVSSFNFLTIKKRLVMLAKRENRKIALVKSLVTIPVMALLIILFHQKIFAANENSLSDTPENLFSSADTGSLGAYERLLDKYGLKGYNPPHKFVEKREKVSDEDLDRMAALYQKLSFDERNMNAVRFIERSKPFGKVIVRDADLSKWQDRKIYGVWIDGKRIINSSLSKYSGADFSTVFVNRLTALARKNDGFSYQIDLMTNKYYADYYKYEMAKIAKHKYMMVYGRSFTKPKSEKDPGLSKLEMEKYNNLIKKYSVLKDGKRYLKNNISESEDHELRMLYVRMDVFQKKNSIPPPPPITSLLSSGIDTVSGTPLPPTLPKTKPMNIKDFHEGKGATAGEIALYESIVRKIESNKMADRNSYEGISDQQTGQMLDIYNKMTFSQREKTIPLPPPPPPPAFSRSTQEKFSEWPVILEKFPNENSRPVVYRVNGINVPDGFNNLVLRTMNNQYEIAILISGKYRATVAEINTEPGRKSFENKYGISLPPPASLMVQK